MTDTAWAWAAKHNQLRTNPVHGEEEAKLVLEDGFSYDEVEGEKSEQRVTMDVEDPTNIFAYAFLIPYLYVASDLWYSIYSKPFSLQDPDLNFLEGGVSNLNSALDILARADDGSATARPEDQAAANSGSFKPRACMESGKLFTMSLILYDLWIFYVLFVIIWDICWWLMDMLRFRVNPMIQHEPPS